MRLVLRQSFPLGRFHATPWRVNPFDDPFGEWPPSPWRFIRAVIARWYQWRRETSGAFNVAELDELASALCDSSYRFHLPVHARRGSPIRQYHPVEFGWAPANKWKGKGKDRRPISQMRAYGTSLVQDNYWCVPRGEAGAIWWFLESEQWTPPLAEALDRCLERIVYFGRAESLTSFHRADGHAPKPNCELFERQVPNSVRVLVPERDATRADLECVTEAVTRNVPLGARVMYAERPYRPPGREEPARFLARADCRLMQLAIGWNVPPEPRAVVRLTARYRSAVVGELLGIKTGNRVRNWSAAESSVRTAIADMLGKDAKGQKLNGHRHTEFLAWWEGSLPTRLLVWREARPFDADEQEAVQRAAVHELSWSAAGPDTDAWKVRLIPLDAAVPPPPGFDSAPAAVWESLTPYVPVRHHLRNGKPRDTESLENQIRRELGRRGVLGVEQVEVREIHQPTWVAVHIPRREAAARAFVGDRRGHWLRLKFHQPVVGPLRLGHSSSFGLGLFVPLPESYGDSVR
jgi:CRISPR-associated protein Csb2